MYVCSRPVVLCNKISLSMMGERVYSVAGARAWNTLLADVKRYSDTYDYLRGSAGR